MLTLKFALRSFARTPFVTLVAVASLALGIGANTAIFTLFDQLLLRPLAVENPTALVNLGAPGPKPGSSSCNEAGDCDQVFSYPMFKDLEREQTMFTGIALHRTFGANFTVDRQTESGEGLFVSGSYFPLLGVRPALGRLLGPEDDRAPGQSPVAVVSYRYWQTRLSARPDVVGQPLLVNGQPLTIVGVAREGFDGTTFGSRPSVFVPVTLSDQLDRAPGRLDNRRSYWAYLFARLKPGTSIEQARTAINVPYHAILNDVEAGLQTGMSDQTLARFRAKSILVTPGLHGQSQANTEAVAPLSLLLGVAAFVLVIACANVANLLLARAASRETEIAVRLAIGASRWQLVRQLLVESCLLAAAGGLLGLPVAHWTLQGVLRLLPAEATSVVDFHLDWRVLVFAGLVALATGLLFGLFPAWQGTRPDLARSIKSQAGRSSGARAAARFRWLLATGQITLSMALLACAGFFVKSLVNVSRVSLGIAPERVVTFGVSPELNGYPPERSRQIFDALGEALAALPGVSGVTSARVPLLAGDSWGANVRVEGFDAGPDTDTSTRRNEIGSGYFRVLESPILAGREFTDADTLGAPKVAIVNQAFARKFNLSDPVGRHMAARRDPGQALDIEIVGLARDAKYSDVKDEVPPVFFVPARQDERLGTIYFYVRTDGPVDALLTSVPGVVARVDATLPVENLRTLPQQVRDNVFLDRFVTILSSAFAVLATLLAAIGLYGVLAYTVAQRTREIGVRMALGAEPSRVRSMVLRQVAIMTGAGGALGLAAAVGIGTLAGSLLYRLDGRDPVVLAASAAALVLVALAAGYVPARRASRVDPMRALRYE